MKFKNGVQGNKGSGILNKTEGSTVKKGETPSSIKMFNFFRGDSTNFIKCTCPFCAISQFQAMQIEVSPKSLNVKFPIRHHIPNSHILDVVDGIPPMSFKHKIEKDKMINSSLKLKFTQDGNKWFLRLECCAYPEVYDYQLEDLLTTFVKSMSNRGFLKVLDKTELAHIGHSKIPVRHLFTYDDLDLDGVGEEILDTIRLFYVNCLKRFEELTYKREEKSYANAQELGSILDAMLRNYKDVSPYQYGIALSKLKEIEETETYNSDPMIILSLTPVGNLIETLRQRALVSGWGIEINEKQLDDLFIELAKHEGKIPEKGIWFAVGAVERLKCQLESFFNIEKQNDLTPAL